MFSLCTIISVVALGKIGGELDCKALSAASLRESAGSQSRAGERRERFCSSVMCNTRAHRTTGTATLVPGTASSSQGGRKRPHTESSWLGASSQLGARVWKHKSLTKATVFICCWSHCPTWISLMPFKIHFQSPQPPEALTATMQLWMVGKSISFWVCLF